MGDVNANMVEKETKKPPKYIEVDGCLYKRVSKKDIKEMEALMEEGRAMLNAPKINVSQKVTVSTVYGEMGNKR